jgi:SSS family solute:Na+ symporter/sodium/pantothenate symporter
VYGLAAASLVPVLFGVLVRRSIPLWVVAGAAGIGLCGHLLLNLGLGVPNPAVSASLAIMASLLFGLVGLWLSRDTENRGQSPNTQ